MAMLFCSIAFSQDLIDIPNFDYTTTHIEVVKIDTMVDNYIIYAKTDSLNIKIAESKNSVNCNKISVGNRLFVTLVYDKIKHSKHCVSERIGRDNIQIEPEWGGQIAYIKEVYELNDNKMSLALKSREIADRVLKEFNSIKASKLLFSLNNRYFYIIINTQPNYTEAFVELDKNGNIKKSYVIKNRYGLIKNRYEKELIQLRQNLLSKTQPFDLEKYHSGIITDFSQAYSRLAHNYGKPSYFVVKDTDGNRYGEIKLYSLVWGKDMDNDLIWYLNFRLIAEIGRK